MKILWISDSPTMPTGFGNVTRFVCGGLADRGHQVSILGWWQQGGPTHWHNCALYPSNNAGPNVNVEELLYYLCQLQPDVLITQGDVWWWSQCIINPVFCNFLHTIGIPWILYYPIDSDMSENRLPPNLVSILKTVDLPIAMSRYACDMTQANGVAATHISPGVDTKMFQPPTDKQVAKRALGYEGKFVVLSDARNDLRKLLPRTLEIFQRFAANKDDVILHLHCDPDDIGTRSPVYCYDLRSDIAFLNLTEKVCLTKEMSISKGLPIEQLAQLYQSSDVHLLASWGEGFGLPTLQAAASGVVPLASDYTANQDLVLHHGEAIGIRHFLTDEFGLRRALIDIDNAVSKLETLYRDRELLASKAQKSREFALAYDWQRIVSQWDELLQHEVPRLKASVRSSVNTSSIPTDCREEEGQPDLALTYAERKASESVANFLPTVRLERTLKIPVALPLTKSKQRISGCVYVTSQRDIPVVLMLQRIFPGLKVWSTIPLDFDSSASDISLQTRVVQAHSPQYRPNLAVSTLALDMGGFDPLLPIEAAKLGVPCIGLAKQREQVWLWPKLSLEKPDPIVAAKLGRQMFTDQGIATDLCLEARHHLASTLIESVIQVC